MARNNKILLLKKSSTLSPAPSAGSLEYGELAINYHADVSTVYFKDSANAVKSIIGGNAATIDTATALAIALG